MELCIEQEEGQEIKKENWEVGRMKRTVERPWGELRGNKMEERDDERGRIKERGGKSEGK